MSINRGAARLVLVAVTMLALDGARAWGVEFAGGTGEPNDPYLIATAEQFLAADFNVPGTHFQLCNDIDMERRDVWLPNSFRAHLDGAGFEIQNVVCSRSGFFWIVEAEGSIANLVLANVDLVTASPPEYSGLRGPIGGFVAENFGTITNCGVTGIVATWRVSRVGGFAGLNAGAIVNCYFDGWVMAPWEDLVRGDELVFAYVGGLVSRNAWCGSITNSLARGMVLGNRGVGGLVGCNEGTIRNCYSHGPVLGQVGAGGLVSENTGHLQTCYAANLVTGEMRGGLVGLAGGEFIGSASNCLWDRFGTDCDQSGAGLGVFGLSTTAFALNGWADDPNWVIPTEPDIIERYPRLVWEGLAGTPIPQPAETIFTEGSGTEGDPYVIRTLTDLRNLHESSIYWDKHFILANDLDKPGSSYTMGICPGASFSGTFEGNGHVIRGLGIAPLSSGTPVWNGGLFGHITGEVRNLTLENCKIRGGANSQRIGVLAGTNAGVITNCSATGSITVGAYSQFIGELIGVNFGQVNDCEAAVTIEAGEGSTWIGGLIGADNPPLPR